METQNDPHRPTVPQNDADIVVVGAGLAAAILALRLAALSVPPRILLLEASDTPFGDKTWSFQRTDVAPGVEAWLDHAIAAEWPTQTVRFADLRREIATGYASITSASIARAVAATGHITVRSGARATRLTPTEVVLDGGARIAARCVIDARGHAPGAAMRTAYQKFVGLRVRLAAPHGIAAPVIMDASVPQIDGFRFVYLLPFSTRDIMIEDTRYADGAALDVDAIEAAIHAYAAAHGWTVEAILQRETGVLPVVLGFDRHAFWAGASDVPKIGMRGAFFHSTTGYSLPDAVRVADLVADAWPIGSAALADLLHDHARRRAPRQAFYRFLNRMLFHGAAPENRHLVMQKFYRLPRPTIERFYAGRTSVFDILRILSGRPPIPIHRALRCIPERAPRGPGPEQPEAIQ